MPTPVRVRGSKGRPAALGNSPYTYAIAPPQPFTDNPMLNVLFGVRYPMQDSPSLVRCAHCQRTLIRQAYSHHQNLCEVLQRQRIEEQQLRQIPQSLNPVPTSSTPSQSTPTPAPVSRKRSSTSAALTSSPARGGGVKSGNSAGSSKKVSTSSGTTGRSRSPSNSGAGSGGRKSGGSQQAPPAKRRRVTKKDKPLNLDDMCGVLIAETQEQCRRCLTCKQHSVKAKRVVSGRSKPFSELVELRRKRIALLKQQRVNGTKTDASKNASPIPTVPPKHTVSSIATKDGVVDVYHLEDGFPGSGPGPSVSGEFQEPHQNLFSRHHLLQEGVEQGLDGFPFDSREDSMILSSEDLLGEDEGPTFSLGWRTEDEQTRHLRNSGSFDSFPARGFLGSAAASSSGSVEGAEEYHSSFASSLTSCMLVAVEDQEGNLISISEAGESAGNHHHNPHHNHHHPVSQQPRGLEFTSDWSMEGSGLESGFSGGDWFVLGGGEEGSMDLLQEDGASSPSLTPEAANSINFFSMDDPNLPDQPHFYHEVDTGSSHKRFGAHEPPHPDFLDAYPEDYGLRGLPLDPITTAGDF